MITPADNQERPTWDVATCCGLFVLPDVFQAQFLAEPTALVGLEEHLHSWHQKAPNAHLRNNINPNQKHRRGRKPSGYNFANF